MEVDKLVAWRLALAALREEATSENGSNKPLPVGRAASDSVLVVGNVATGRAVGVCQTSRTSAGK